MFVSNRSGKANAPVIPGQMITHAASWAGRKNIIEDDEENENKSEIDSSVAGTMERGRLDSEVRPASVSNDVSNEVSQEVSEELVGRPKGRFSIMSSLHEEVLAAPRRLSGLMHSK